MKESVMIIDQYDQMIGTMDKLAAHRAGVLHRAFSVFIFNSKGELLLQQRDLNKYHSGGLWTNTCCSHPKLGESLSDAAYRRLQEEMGISCILDHVFNFTYRADVGKGLIEHELDHVFFGVSDELPEPNPAEVGNFTYMTLEKLELELKVYPERYTPWLRICYDLVLENYRNLLNYEPLAD